MWLFLIILFLMCFNIKNPLKSLVDVDENIYIYINAWINSHISTSVPVIYKSICPSFLCSGNLDILQLVKSFTSEIIQFALKIFYCCHILSTVSKILTMTFYLSTLHSQPRTSAEAIQNGRKSAVYSAKPISFVLPGTQEDHPSFALWQRLWLGSGK